MQKPTGLPDNYQTVMPYLILDGARDFIEFVNKVFDATTIHETIRDDNTVRHAEIMIGDSTIMCAEATADFKPQPAGMYINVDDADSRFNKAVEAGATVVMEPADQPYGRSGGVRDAFGNTWWITSPAK